MGELLQLRAPALEAAANNTAANDPALNRLAGEAACLACAHIWPATVPVGAKVSLTGEGDGELTDLECPACGSFKGVYRRFVQYAAPHWQCLPCKSTMFSIILVDGVPCVACVNCGELANALDLFNQAK